MCACACACVCVCAGEERGRLGERAGYLMDMTKHGSSSGLSKILQRHNGDEIRYD